MSHGHEHGHSHGRHERDRYGNPRDLEQYLERLEGKDREEWQKPDAVVAALGLRPGDAACEIGAGPGYFTLRLARAVGERGHVFAVDAQPQMLALLRDRLEAAHLANVSPILGLPGDPLLPPSCCDVALIVNTLHHFGDAPAFLRRLSRALKPGGRIVNIDFHDGDLPVGPPPELRLSREQFLRLAAQAGLHVEREERFLPHQYFVALRAEG